MPGADLGEAPTTGVKAVTETPATPADAGAAGVPAGAPGAAAAPVLVAAAEAEAAAEAPAAPVAADAAEVPMSAPEAAAAAKLGAATRADVAVEEMAAAAANAFDLLTIRGYLANLVVTSVSSLEDKIRKAQLLDEVLKKVSDQIKAKDPKAKRFSLDDKGTVFFHDRMVVPNNQDIRDSILKEPHDTPLAIYPGSNKMYQDIRKSYW
ncbi:uncharacterized protein LOC104582176 [Brachypodium distachyon]|uniref:uncharacterized protein LOC104582176 n=1 Tax=Brachypodium distachyon TaxID=15368 RepID=UPI000530007E|nr:uncharacterized protein LOC104582176 [Brachypodium distachyon]|eukprot:XP_010229837.1 uncharacterized protein LOC104582176 [Brachypodium distachyon]